jgi:hypothetical protein
MRSRSSPRGRGCCCRWLSKISSERFIRSQYRSGVRLLHASRASAGSKSRVTSPSRKSRPHALPKGTLWRRKKYHEESRSRSRANESRHQSRSVWGSGRQFNRRLHTVISRKNNRKNYGVLKRTIDGTRRSDCRRSRNCDRTLRAGRQAAK